jgi:DNA adenine methylase
LIVIGNTFIRCALTKIILKQQWRPDDGFGDKEQIELADFVERLRKKGAKILLSNPDPKNSNIKDEFFDKLYSNFDIDRIKANRSINSDKNGRGKINELLIASR